MRVRQCLRDLVQDYLGVDQYVMVPEPQDRVSFPNQKLRPPSICFNLRDMLAPVDFHHEFALRTAEVNDEVADHILTPKLGSANLPCPQPPPQCPLCVGLFLSETPSSVPEFPHPGPLPTGPPLGRGSILVSRFLTRKPLQSKGLEPSLLLTAEERPAGPQASRGSRHVPSVPAGTRGAPDPAGRHTPRPRRGPRLDPIRPTRGGVQRNGGQ